MSSSGVPLWNYSSNTRFVGKGDLLRDADHLTHKGAHLFSRILGQGALKDEFEDLI
jgi:hypothetical protein